jgi:hypothetical protein
MYPVIGHLKDPPVKLSLALFVQNHFGRLYLPRSSLSDGLPADWKMRTNGFAHCPIRFSGNARVKTPMQWRRQKIRVDYGAHNRCRH